MAGLRRGGPVAMVRARWPSGRVQGVDRALELEGRSRICLISSTRSARTCGPKRPSFCSSAMAGRSPPWPSPSWSRRAPGRGGCITRRSRTPRHPTPSSPPCGRRPSRSAAARPPRRPRRPRWPALRSSPPTRPRAAGLKADMGDLPGALALWDAVAHDDSADKLLRDLANLLWAQHGIDAGDPPVVRARLAALEKPDNPFRALAEEAGALLDLRLGQTDAAKAALQKLASDPTAPEGVHARANGLLDRIGIGG